MLRIAKMTDYGTLVMTSLARAPESLHSAADLAQATHVAEPTVSKLLKLLARHGLVTSARGVRGGYRLALAPENISMTDIIAALEGPLALTECGQSESSCSMEQHCDVRSHWLLINRAIRGALDQVTLAQLTTPAAALSKNVHPIHMIAGA